MSAVSPSVSLYLVMGSLIGALALICLMVRQALDGRQALGWLTLGLLGGVGTTLLYAGGSTDGATMAALATLDTLSVACACFAIRAALDRPAVPRGPTLVMAVALAVSVGWMLAFPGAPFLAAIPFQLGMFVLLASTVATAGRQLRGVAEWAMFLGIATNLVTYAIRLPFWPSLMDAGRAFPSAASGWLNLVMLVTGSIFVPLVVFGIIGREVGALVGGYRDRSERDGMTGLHNRLSFQTRFDEAKAASGMLIIADIDHFKAINDRYGHHVGDQVILAFARVMAGARGIAARVGGEEFALAMPGATPEQARAESEAIRRAFHDLRTPAIDDDHFLSASFGVAPWARGDGFGEVFALADEALYAAKARGRNRTVVAPLEPLAEPRLSAAASRRC